MWCRVVVCGALVVACGGRHERNAGDEPFECALGELSGNWVMRHVELDGDCGAVPDRPVTFGLAGELRPDGCSVEVAVISVDRCGLHQDFSCPPAGAAGHDEDWVVVLSHEAPARLAGVGSLNRLGECVSAYDLALTPF